MFLLMLILCMAGYAQAILDPSLSEEMARRNDDEQIKVIVVMKSQYNRAQLNRRAEHYASRAGRREFVVNELKEFAAASQYDLRRSLSEMERKGWVSSPIVLWMANALSFDATQAAICDLARRSDIEIIGHSIDYECIPDGEVVLTASPTGEITPNLIQVHADQVWDLGYRGEGVVVAIIDTGVNYVHYDLADHLWDGGEAFPHHGYDVVFHDDDPMDDHGHGTHCAGILCGDGTAGVQTGMAPEVTLMCVKAMNANGHCSGTNISEGIQWAIEHGCDMFSMSMGIPNASTSDRILLRRTCEAALDAGIVAAIAVGNEGDKLDMYPVPNNVRLPGNCPPPYMDEVQGEHPGGLSCSVCVGAVDYDDNAASFSSRGPTQWKYEEYHDYPYQPGIGLIRPDVCAPGVDIKSLYYNSHGGYFNMSGTSMATPCVAGCMALMLSKNKNLMPAEVCRILEETAVPLAEGKSNIYGFGRIDALAAVEAVPMGGLRYLGFSINDTAGNNNHKPNPGETVNMSLTLNNIFDEPVGGVSAVFVTEDEHLTLFQDSVAFPDFSAYDTLTVEDAFAFKMDNQVNAYQKIRFAVKVYADGELIGVFKDCFVVCDYVLEYGAIAVLNDTNGDAILNPGETADLRIMIDNRGNDMAHLDTGNLSTSNLMLTLNESQKPFGDIEAGMTGYADFSVSLDATATEDIVIPLSLDIVDSDGLHTELMFDYRNICTVIFSLYDSFNDGWQDNYLQVDYSDGTPSERLSIDDGSSSVFIRELTYKTAITLSWHDGQWPIECSFEVAYEDGTVFFQNVGGFSGKQTFILNCGVPETCAPIRNIGYRTNGNQVTLTWDVPDDITPTAYKIDKDGAFLVSTAELTVEDYVDNGVHDYCVYSVYYNCQSEPVCQEVTIIGLDENDTETSVFPNPALGNVTVHCPGMKLIEVYSLEGRLVRSVEVEADSCQLDGLGSGVYMVRIDKRKQFIVLHL